MSRQLDNLKRVFTKLQARYGDDDEIVSQVKHDLEWREGVESSCRQWPDSNTPGIPGHVMQRRSSTGSGGASGRTDLS
jgi:hypothetical protein